MQQKGAPAAVSLKAVLRAGGGRRAIEVLEWELQEEVGVGVAFAASVYVCVCECMFQCDCWQSAGWHLSEQLGHGLLQSCLSEQLACWRRSSKDQ